MGLGTGSVPVKVPAEPYGGATMADSAEGKGIAPMADTFTETAEE